MGSSPSIGVSFLPLGGKVSGSSGADVVDEPISPSEMPGDSNGENDSEGSQPWEIYHSIGSWNKPASGVNAVEHLISPQSSEADDIRLPDTENSQESENDQESAVETKADDEEDCKSRLEEIMGISNEVYLPIA